MPDGASGAQRHDDVTPRPVQGPLAGLRVLDMATMMAAPWAATYMADFGADVIKLEQPGDGDHARRFGLSARGQPLFWKTLSRNKRSIAVDLKSADARDVMTRLVREADIVIENFRPGVLDRLGYAYPALAAINPRVVLLSVTGYGQTGPYAKRPGFGTLIEGLSGFAYANGHAEGPPTLPPIPLADGVAAMFAAFAVMVAVYERDVGGSGEGQHIDLSLLEPLARLMEGHVLEYAVLGIVRQRLGNASLTSAPRNAYRAGDGKWIALSASAQPVFERLMRTIGRAELIEDERFGSNDDRVHHRDELDRILQAWIGQRTRDDALTLLGAGGAAAGPIYDIAEFVNDPHVRARGMFETHADPDLGDVVVPSVGARFSRTPGAVRHLGQALGEATDEILGELGYSEDDIRRLRASGAVSGGPGS